MMHMNIEPYQLPHVIAYSQLLVDSYKRWTGWDLVGGSDIAYALYNAPFAITSQGNQPEPVIQYANRAALDVWEMEWSQFIGMPAHLSAEADDDIQKSRADVLAQARDKGWALNYNGKRISRTGTRFEILNTVLWNVTDTHGQSFGQAARIGAWRYL